MTYDNACKYLAENYPEDFVRWLLGREVENVEVLKTELSIEPILADSLTFLQAGNLILQVEFQTLPYSSPPIPLRMLDYYVRLKRQYGCGIAQVVIFLQETTSELAYIDRYEDTNTYHRYRVIRLWQQDPALFLANPGLLPLATLTRSDSPENLLAQIAQRVATIEESARQQNISACVEILAGLRFEETLITQLFTDDIMRESVIYQRILREGRSEGRSEGLQQGLQRGLQQGRSEGLQQEARSLVMRLILRRFGTIEPELEAQIEQLSLSQLEELAEALLDFTALTDLTNWLDSIEQQS
ncbi:MAG: Rpn family recombination-promoting nuclease/putative transposase [Oscillatoria sp. PMC 1068.18]|nr:Rpn family recombination-promoting nuclease/putative transposase [Oscillatoria sp. PMC 1076.18]MEC4990271.1 Rpn family recombination-promoting nuclease/putative transposase [Oscillatoria sp. PMC 1068.18]